ncbi:hypothetical protein Q5424_17445 [Conexibacter sp. JD483]|uniref:hypothetical protein n=1 Tax=unclassified Conexibacter TaxID=2627773 RepID=UPI0027172A8C|nr:MULTISPECIES: hypothetical protein [unclassified Conexibacter]MDO8186470.1 hypothetical protein [Conexibacter sp. CPCC 205706]MDO8200039.1 hypothetical protein [Conexibacter sp. CPCC 205762]MDR9370885.1 hypothetical protein [Conexibacter sp. JD483]
MQVTLRDSERDELAALAAERNEPEATTAARLIRAGLFDRGASLAAVVRRRAASGCGNKEGHGTGAADWLPPERHAAAIDALRNRYPQKLRHLRADALDLPEIAEQAAALAVWREAIDRGAHADPRIELAFGNSLQSFANLLQTTSRRHR